MAKKVTLYTATYCPYCHAAKHFLKSKNIAFEEIDVTQDDALRNELVGLSGQSTVPQIFADGVSIGGYDDLVRYYENGHTLL